MRRAGRGVSSVLIGRVSKLNRRVAIVLLITFPRVQCSRDVGRLLNMCHCFHGFALRNSGYNLSCGLKEKTYGIMTCGINNLAID